MEVVWTYIATVVFSFFFLIWRNSDWYNTMIKFSLLLLAVFGALISFKHLGIIFII